MHFFTIQGDYTNNKYTFVDSDHQYDLFKYGYVGEFNTYKQNIYSGGTAVDSSTGIIYTGQIHSGWGDTLYTFDENQYTNVDLANYTRAYFQMFDDYGLSSFVGTENDGVIRTAADLRGQGLRNGDLPASVYSLYGNHGTMYNGSAKQENTQTTFKASGSADIKDHEFSFGFEFEQRDDSYWGMGPMGMWGLMRQLTNKHILQRDLANPIPVFDANGVYQDTINYDRLFVAEEQSTFDRNLRDALNRSFLASLKHDQVISQTDYIDIDALSPDIFDIKMFSPDELLNSGSSLVYYYGYDIHGNKLTSNPTLKDFFEKQDSDGNYLREIASFQPIYTAGYIQDKVCN